MRILASGFALLLLVAPANAQSTGDPRWRGWTGCWDLVTENAREGTPGPTAGRRDQRTAPPDPVRPQVCVQTTENGGAIFSTRVGTQTPIVQTVIPDGKDRPITEEGCTGTQRAEWSADGLRLFARAEMTCKTDQGLRRVSGLALLGANGRWTDVQSVDVSGRESFRVRQYRRAAGTTTPTTPLAATALTLEHVVEASTKVSPRALEAALVETRASFDLTSKDLLELDAANVPASVVDLIVALSYPDRFVIERTASVDRAYSPIIDEPLMVGWAFGYPVWSDFYSPFYGPYSPYYYSPFAYPYYPYYGGGGGYVIDGGGGGGGNLPQQPSGRGRVVDGQGYTRVTPRGAEPSMPATAGATASSSGGGGSSTASSSGGSSGGSVSSQGFSGGGSGGGSSGGDGGRTAQPR